MPLLFSLFDCLVQRTQKRFEHLGQGHVSCQDVCHHVSRGYHFICTTHQVLDHQQIDHGLASLGNRARFLEMITQCVGISHLDSNDFLVEFTNLNPRCSPSAMLPPGAVKLATNCVCQSCRFCHQRTSYHSVDNSAVELNHGTDAGPFCRLSESSLSQNFLDYVLFFFR